MLKLTKRAGIYYLRGTIAVGKTRRNLYESTGLRVRDAGSKDHAQTYLETRRQEILAQIQNGPENCVTFAEAMDCYIDRRIARLKERNPRFDQKQPDSEIDQALEISLYLESKGIARLPLGKLTQAHIDGFFHERHMAKGNSLATARRHASVYYAIMNMAVRKGWAPPTYPRPDLGEYDQISQPIVGKYFEPPEIHWMIENAPEHFRPIVAMGFATGRRTSDLAWLARPGRYDPVKHSGELIMAQGNERIFLGYTKNGKPHETFLPDWLLPILHAHLARRSDRYPELFLTNREVPYQRPKGRQRGGVFKRAFNTLVYKLAVHLLVEARQYPVRSAERMHMVKRSRVVRQATPHWFRHNAASHMYAKGRDDSAVMDHVGWEDPRMAKRYRHNSPERGKGLANSLDFGMVEAAEERAKSVQLIKKA